MLRAMSWTSILTAALTVSCTGPTGPGRDIRTSGDSMETVAYRVLGFKKTKSGAT